MNINLNNIDKKIYCINCGKIGHISKKCLFPITSIGNICFILPNIDLNSIINYSKKIQNNYLFNYEEINKMKKINILLSKINDNSYNDMIEYLLIMRKNSLNYIELIRGKYDINNLDYIQRIFQFITIEEKKRILTNTFDFLWVDLWGNNNNKNDYEDSYNKFITLKNGYYIKKNDINLFISFEILINDSIFKFTTPEWGFPKGRRNLNEKNIECAKREFEEETLLSPDTYNIINITPLEEIYMGSNNIKYKHIYYISQIKDCGTELILDKNNITQKIEIGDIKWLNFNDSIDKIRDYNIEKKYVLINLHYTIKYILTNFNKNLSTFLNKL